MDKFVKREAPWSAKSLATSAGPPKCGSALWPLPMGLGEPSGAAKFCRWSLSDGGGNAFEVYRAAKGFFEKGEGMALALP